MGSLGSKDHEIVEFSSGQRVSRAASKITIMDFSEAISGALCPVLGSSYKRDMRLLEQLQQRAKEMLKGQELRIG